MRYIILLSAILSITVNIKAQDKVEITDMKWGTDYKIHITFSNDSSTIHDVKALYHSQDENGNEDQITYYPVYLDPTFVSSLKDKKIDTTKISEVKSGDNNKTLWGAIHPLLGGGFIHFINSLIYTVESGNLDLKAPLMKRPETDWKPSPITESYKRTKKWKYYIPDNQKLAHKEYKIQEKNNELGDIKLLPEYFITLFLNTDDKQYKQLIQNKEINKVAIINVMRLMLGSRYLGSEQIAFVKGAVIKAVIKYNMHNLPSIIIFDNYNAAVAMTLDSDGYNIEKVVFHNAQSVSDEEKQERFNKMQAVIKQINEANKKVFEKNLKTYYKR
jgi:hypothetical protein